MNDSTKSESGKSNQGVACDNPGPPSDSVREDKVTVAAPTGRVLAGGVLWIAIARWSSQVVAWAMTLYMARLLTAREYGSAGLVAVISSWVYALTEFGVGSTILAMRTEAENQISRLHSFVCGMTGIGSLLIAAFSVPLAVFLHDEQLAPILAVGGLLVVAQGLSAVPMAQLQLALDYRRVARIEFTRSLVSTVSVAVFATAGARVWSLPLAALAGSLTQAYMASRATSAKFDRFRLSELRTLLTYAWHIVTGRMAWNTYINADTVLVSRAVGTSMSGQYQFAWNIATLPGEKLVNVVAAAMLPFFSAIADDHASLRRYLLLITEGVALIVFPIFIGIILVADQGVPLLFGDKWLPAIMPLKLLICFALIQAVSTVVANAASALRLAREANLVPLIAVVILPPLFYVAARYHSITAVAFVWLAAAPAMTAWPLRLVLRRLDIRLFTYLSCLLSPSTAAAAMAVSVLAFQRYGTRPDTPILAVSCDVAIGAVGYVLTLLVAFPGHLQRIRDTVRIKKLVPPAE